MKKLLAAAILMLAQISFISAQSSTYEAEIMLPKGAGNRDTREVNAIVIFEKDTIIVKSRRSAEVYKTFKVAEISEVQHNFARSPKLKLSGRDVALSLLTGFPAFLFSRQKERNWVTILADGNFAVLKAENDNYRQLLAEFAVRKIKIVSHDEDAEKELN